MLSKYVFNLLLPLKMSALKEQFAINLSGIISIHARPTDSLMRLKVLDGEQNNG